MKNEPAERLLDPTLAVGFGTQNVNIIYNIYIYVIVRNMKWYNIILMDIEIIIGVILIG